MLSIICESCKETFTNGTGRWFAQNGAIQFYCANCEGELVLNALKNAKPKVRVKSRKTEPTVTVASN